MVSAIVAVSPDWGIGDGKGMLYRLPGDLKYFRAVKIGRASCRERVLPTV